MAFAVASRVPGKARAPRRGVAKGQFAREQSLVDSHAGFAKPVLPPHAAALPIAPVLQTKLKVGASDDKFEQEADRVAGEVMRKGHGRGAALDSRRDQADSTTVLVQRL